MSELTCKKVQYTSQKAAQEDIARIRKKSDRSRLPLREYYCYHCNFWHLTSKPSEINTIESTDLKTQIHTLQQRIETLETELKEANKEINRYKNIPLLDKAERREVLREETITAKNKEITILNQKIRKLREDNNILISKNIQLEKKLNVHGT